MQGNGGNSRSNERKPDGREGGDVVVAGGWAVAGWLEREASIGRKAKKEEKERIMEIWLIGLLKVELR